MNDLSECIGIALMVVRMHRGLNQENLADMMTQGDEKVTQGYISKAENGYVTVSWDRLARFCKCLKCLPSQMVELAEFLIEQKSLPEQDVIASLLKESHL
jgi:transcriptional regulator with XRE-family HTH domain